MDTITIGIIGAGNRGRLHAQHYGKIPDVAVSAVADIDEGVARELAADASIDDVYTDYVDLLADDGIDAVSVCVHNNLHAPIAISSFEADKHVFCEKPMAGSYADAKRMADAADEAGKRLAVQNARLFSPETTAAKRLIDEGRLGEISFARAVSARRRGRPYVDGYGTPSFVQKATAGGGPVYDIGTYEIGQLLYLLDNPAVERVVGHTFGYTDDLCEELVGDNLSTYRERLIESGYDVEDAGTGVATLAGDRVLSVRAAWHMYLPDEQSVIAGSEGGIAFDPFEFRTSMADYETTASFDLDEYEQRQGLLQSDTGYDAERRTDQFTHWIETLRGMVDDPIPTGEIALTSMLMMEGIYLSVEQGRELTTEEITDYSASVSIDP